MDDDAFLLIYYPDGFLEKFSIRWINDEFVLFYELGVFPIFSYAEQLMMGELGYLAALFGFVF